MSLYEKATTTIPLSNPLVIKGATNSRNSQYLQENYVTRLRSTLMVMYDILECTATSMVLNPPSGFPSVTKCLFNTVISRFTYIWFWIAHGRQPLEMECQPVANECAVIYCMGTTRLVIRVRCLKQLKHLLSSLVEGSSGENGESRRSLDYKL